MRELYETKKFHPASLQLLNIVKGIVDRYQNQGIMLTARQVYYQVVVLGLAWFPNAEKSYKRLTKLLSDARLAGQIDWDAIEDRARRPRRASEFRDVSELMDAAIHSFRLPRMEGQRHYVELWCEKDALSSVLWPLAYQHHVVMMVNRGYSSSSAMHEAAQRIDAACRDREGVIIKEPTVLYLGDLDPSGEDMVRDIDERLNRFLAGYYSPERFVVLEEAGVADPVEGSRMSPGGRPITTHGSVRVHVEKLALNMDQVETYNPPPNPAKMSDARAAKFVERHGDESWEVDALPPEVLQQCITERLEALLDDALIQRIRAVERVITRRLQAVAQQLDAEDLRAEAEAEVKRDEEDRED